MVASTDNSGHYLLEAPPGSELDVVIPSGFKSQNGHLSRLRIRMYDADRVDIALAVDTAEPPAEPVQPLAWLTGDARLAVIGLAVLGGILLVSQTILAAVLLITRRTYRKSMAQQDVAMRQQRAKDISLQLKTTSGWQAVAERLLADALREAVSIDEEAGILDATVEPSPRFAVVTRDGRRAVFTTNPGHMKQARLVRPGDRMIDVSALSVASHADIGALWDYVLTSRNMLQVTPPSMTHWFVVVHAARSRAAAGTAPTQNRLAQKLRALRGRSPFKALSARRLGSPRRGQT